MRPALLSRAGLSVVVVAAATAACALQTSADDGQGSMGTSATPIEGGRVINAGSDSIAMLVPYYTVWISSGCTGVIVSPNQILTAAHCQVDDSTDVEFYPLWPSTGNTPNPSPTLQIDTTKTLVEQGVNCPSDLGTGCYSYQGSSTHYADIQILTLTDNVPSGYLPAMLGVSGSYSTANLGGVLNGAMWLVGTGNMNMDQARCPAKSTSNTTTVYNLNHVMEWVALDGLSSSDTNATVALPGGGGTLQWPGGSTASGVGMFTTSLRGVAYSDPGDSGGPVFQYQLIGSKSKLVLVGIESGGIDCTHASTGSYIDWYTSVVYGDNYTWLTDNIPSLKPAITASTQSVTTFGAAL
jgi:hypothetical protein